MIAVLLFILQSAYARESVAILISDSLPEYQDTAQGFVDSYPGSVQIFHIEGNKNKALT